MAILGMNNSRSGMTVHRIEALTDSIFAFSMTLLVLTIDLPKKGTDFTVAGLHTLLLGQFQEFFNYALSFILLANLWIIHHQQFHFFRYTDRYHLWINILLLMFVVLVPFSTSIVGDFPNEWMAELFFSLNIFVVGVFLYWNWSYATTRHRLVDPALEYESISRGKKRVAVIPLVSCLAIILSLVYPRLSSYAYILVPIILFIPQFHSSNSSNSSK